MSLRASIHLFALLGLLGIHPGTAFADDNDDLVEKVGWTIVMEKTVEEIADRCQQYDMRIMDLEAIRPNMAYQGDVEGTICGGSWPTPDGARFDAVLVDNEESYETGYWWYYDLTAVQVDEKRALHDGRLTVLEPYWTTEGRRYSIVMVPAGEDGYADNGWQRNMTIADVTNWLAQNPDMRINNIEPYHENPEIGYTEDVRYAFSHVRNSGAQAKTTWVYLDVSKDHIESEAEHYGARVIDLEYEPTSVSYSALLVPEDGNAWRIVDEFSASIQLAPRQYASRPVDIERTPNPSCVRWEILMRQNTDDRTIEVSEGMHEILGDWDAQRTNGFILRELTGLGAPNHYIELAGLKTVHGFEPGNGMASCYAYHALEQVNFGTENLDAQVMYPEDSNGTCPDESGSMATDELAVCLKRMLAYSDLEMAEGVRARYGSAAIENSFSGGGVIYINEPIGCMCGDPNRASLNTFAWMYSYKVNADLGPFKSNFLESHEMDPYGISVGSKSLYEVVVEELVTSGLPSFDQYAFLNAMQCYGIDSKFRKCESGYRGNTMLMAQVGIPFHVNCEIEHRTFFSAAFVDGGADENSSEAAVDHATFELLRPMIREAIGTWRHDPCDGEYLACVGYSISGSAGAEIALVVPASIDLETLEIGGYFENLSQDSTWAGDLLVAVEDPNGNALEFGGYNWTFGHQSMGDFPETWDSSESGYYGYVMVDVASAGLSGTGDWIIRIANGYGSSLGSAWDGGVCLRGSEVPVRASDLNGDGSTDGRDMAEMLGRWGVCNAPQDYLADLTGDEVVDGADLAVLLGEWN
jgi:hypothetical protein